MKYILLVSYWLIICVEVLAMSTEEMLTVRDSPFAISAERNLEAFWKGEKLISGDMHSWLTNQNVGLSAENYEVFRGEEWQYTNAWSKNGALPFRREIGISPDGKRIEISFQSHQDALMSSYVS